MKKYVKAFLFGLITWLIPFLAGFFFYNTEGQLNIDLFLFKSIMLLLGSLVGATLLILYFRKVENRFLVEGLFIGVLWYIINLLLDVVILIPMAKMDFNTYFIQIGLRYFNIIIISIGFGFALQLKTK